MRPLHNTDNNRGNDAGSIIDRATVIESLKSKTCVLFIDDDRNFNVVKILKDSGWKNTKTVVDIKTLDIPVVKDADIVFVDINGVGKMLNLQYEGLDLALMLKQKYPEKKIIIYSATKNISWRRTHCHISFKILWKNIVWKNT